MVAHLPTRPRRRIAPLLLWALQTHSPVGRVLQEISMCSNIPDAHEPNSAADMLKASATHDADRVLLRAIAFRSVGGAPVRE